jgi:hypothetical protein
VLKKFSVSDDELNRMIAYQFLDEAGIAVEQSGNTAK